jgi:hypothetical protein
MPRVSANFDHSTTTRRGGYRYQFTTKHHGGTGAEGASQWVVSLTLADEFAIFDIADWNEISDSRENLFGVWRAVDGSLGEIGTWRQQIAEFPSARAGESWHGYPCYPIGQSGPEELQGDRCKPEKSVFTKLLQAGLITRREQKRLRKAEHT